MNHSTQTTKQGARTMTKKQKEKLEKRLKELENLFNQKDRSKINSSELISEYSEVKFKLNKQNINITLKGNNKYYWANQCAEFTKNLLTFGYGHISKEEIKANGVCFNKYSINNGYNQYCTDLKRFSNKEEMLGFVKGYNEAIFNNQI
jgi:hypothetical protein